MSYVDLEISANNTTTTPSRRSHRSRASLLREASLSMSCNMSSPVQSSNDQVFSVNDTPSTQPPITLSQSVNPHFHESIPTFPAPPLPITHLEYPHLSLLTLILLRMMFHLLLQDLMAISPPSLPIYQLLKQWSS